MEIKFFQILQHHLEGENLSKLSRDLGVSKQLLHDWVKAKRYPSLKNIDVLKKLADYLGYDLESLIFGKLEGKNGKVLSSVFFEDESRRYNIMIRRMDIKSKAE